MRIAQIAPLCERVPPPAYGGTELVVGLLTDELVRRGHEVVLFASGDSETLAELQPGCATALRHLDMGPDEYAIYEQRQLSRVFQQSDHFDIIHSHVDHSALPYASLTQTPVLHTLHGIFTPLSQAVFQQHCQQPLISISNSQRCPELGLNYLATVYNAINVDSFDFCAQPSDPPYLVFLGRMSIEKGPHLAIEIAQRTGWKLKIVGKIDADNHAFFDQEIAPHVDGEQIEFLGEANHGVKNQLLGGAAAMLFPILWREPFGLVMAESMACGTPVIAMNLGSVAEVVIDGETGFVCQSVEEAVAAVGRLPELSRRACRDRAETHFSLARMVDDYEAAYRQLLAERLVPPGSGGSGAIAAGARISEVLGSPAPTAEALTAEALTAEGLAAEAIAPANPPFQLASVV